MSLPRPLRLTRRRDYEAVRLRGASTGGRLLGMGILKEVPPEKALPDQHAAPPTAAPRPKPRLGVIVPKALGPAPMRNRIKRRLREILREVMDDVPPYFIVTIARRGAVGADFADLRAEWRRLARRLGVLAPPPPKPPPVSRRSS